jgi:hypothetical protein
MPLVEPKNTWRAWNWTQQLPVCVNYVNLWGASIKLYSVVGKDVSLDVNTEKTKQTFITSSPICRTSQHTNRSAWDVVPCMSLEGSWVPCLQGRAIAFYVARFDHYVLTLFFRELTQENKDRIPVGARFSAPVQTGGRGVALATHHHLSPRLKKE